jgi:hypothetical protein
LVFFLPQRNKTVCCDQRRLLAWLNANEGGFRKAQC